MKKQTLLLGFLCLCFLIPTYADNRRPHSFSNTITKDNGEGSRVNIGFSFAPTFDWMYSYTEGYERNGVVLGMRYGFPININLTEGKNYYISTGLFCEQLGGKLKFFDNIPISTAFTLTNTETQRTYRAFYMTIPIGVTLKSKTINNFYICGNVGLYNSFLLKGSNIDTYTINDELWSRQRVESSETAVIKEAAYIGLGLEYSITQDFRAGFYINYANTLTNYFKGRGQAQNSITGIDEKAKLGYLELVMNINFF